MAIHKQEKLRGVEWDGEVTPHIERTYPDEAFLVDIHRDRIEDLRLIKEEKEYAKRVQFQELQRIAQEEKKSLRSKTKDELDDKNKYDREENEIGDETEQAREAIRIAKRFHDIGTNKYPILEGDVYKKPYDPDATFEDFDTDNSFAHNKTLESAK